MTSPSPSRAARGHISQGTLGQPGDPWSVSNSPAPTATYAQTNFTGGPYHVNAFGAATAGHVMGDYITVLGHLRAYGNGNATLDAKYDYFATGVAGNSWNTELDKTTNSITWDCTYSFNFSGTMTRMLLFENGQFPFFVFGFRASRNFQDVVGLDPGRIAAWPLANTYVGYPINMTNLAVEANSWSWSSPPGGYGTLNYQWYQNGVPISGATASATNLFVIACESDWNGADEWTNDAFLYGQTGSGPDPYSPSASVLTGANIAGFVPFRPTLSIAETADGPEITYTGVLLAGPTLSSITNPVSISSYGPSLYSPPGTGTNRFYRTSK